MSTGKYAVRLSLCRIRGESYYHAYMMKLRHTAELFTFGEDSAEKFREILERKPAAKTYYQRQLQIRHQSRIRNLNRSPNQIRNLKSPRKEYQRHKLAGAADFTYLIAKEWGKSLIYRGHPPLFYSAYLTY